MINSCNELFFPSRIRRIIFGDVNKPALKAKYEKAENISVPIINLFIECTDNLCTQYSAGIFERHIYATGLIDANRFGCGEIFGYRASIDF